MFKLKRNQVIITVLVVMIAVAGYLNYQDTHNQRADGFASNPNYDIDSLTQNQENEDSVPADLTIETPAPVALEDLLDLVIVTDVTETAEGLTEVESNVVSALVDDGTYFVQARLDREQSRARQREVLLELINNENVTDEVRAESAESMLTIQRRIEKESAAEALIQSRGFNEVFVRISENSVDVVVDKATLTDSELAQIEDVITRKVGVDSEAIRISPMTVTN